MKKFKPIRLSNFIIKIIPEQLNTWLSPILPNLISLNLSRFVKVRSTSENIMLAQEIIHQIKKSNIGKNVIVKLDNVKEYDRVAWDYICLVVRNMGFNQIFNDIV